MGVCARFGFVLQYCFYFLRLKCLLAFFFLFFYLYIAMFLLYFSIGSFGDRIIVSMVTVLFP